MPPRCPRELEIDFISDVREGLDKHALAERYDRAPKTVVGWIKQLRHDGKLEEDGEPASPCVLDEWKIQYEKPDWRELLEHARRSAEFQNEMRPVRTTATRTIRTDRPVFVVSMSDFHHGSPATDYESFMLTSDLLLSDERFFFCVAGPDQELAFAWFRSAEAVLNQTIPPWMQVEAYKLWLNEMLPRCLCICGDNHGDERLEKVLGDIGLLWRDDVPYFRTYGVLDLVLDDGGGDPVVYRGMMAHRWKGSSIYHDLQPALRMMRRYPDADFYVTAHTHKPAYMHGVFFEGRPAQHLMVTGTFKTGADLYGMRNFGGKGVLGLPTLALWPDEHRIAYFQSPELALEAMG